MEGLIPIIVGFAGLVLGALLVYFADKRRLDDAMGMLNRRDEDLKAQQQRVTELTDDLTESTQKCGVLEGQFEQAQRAHKERVEELNDMKKSATDAFKALAADALKDNREQFVEAAGEKIDPLSEQLKEYEELLIKMQVDHTERSTQTQESVKNLVGELEKQRAMATDLKSLLKGPTQRGRVGEMMLEVILERVGLVDGKHYTMQQSSQVDGQTRRPDCTVYMPNNGRIVIDCKTPLNSYHDAMEVESEEDRATHLKQHAANVRRDIDALNSKQYRDEAVGNSLVVMYLPIEASLAAALYHDTEIMDYGLERNVVLSSPTLLFALLQTIALGWQQEQLRKNSAEVANLGTELIKRLATVAGHLRSHGKGLKSAVEGYNKTIASVDSQLFATARRFKRLGVPGDTSELVLGEVSDDLRDFNKDELTSPPDRAAIEALTPLDDDESEDAQSGVLELTD